MIHEISCSYHVLENGFMYVSVCINTWYIHDTFMKFHVDHKCLHETQLFQSQTIKNLRKNKQVQYAMRTVDKEFTLQYFVRRDVTTKTLAKNIVISATSITTRSRH